jgi:hypothetical protein
MSNPPRVAASPRHQRPRIASQYTEDSDNPQLSRGPPDGPFFSVTPSEEVSDWFLTG